MLGSRWALNIYFWVFLFLLKHSDADDQAYSKWVCYALMLFFMGFFALLSYVNNLVLMPRLFFAKKRLLYFPSVLALVFGLSFIYTLLLKWLPSFFPGLDMLRMSIVMDPVSEELSVASTFAEMETYFFMMSIWVCIFSLLNLYHHSEKKLRVMQENLAKHREVELAFLKNQIHPHFLFNTLNNLYALSLQNAQNAPESILKLSSVLRYMIYEANAPLVAFSKEKEIIQAYVDIEMLRLSDSPRLQFSILSDKNYDIPPLIWLPVLENAFKHTRNVEDLELDFRFGIREDRLHIYCKNNLPLVPVKREEKGGLGLSNLQKRLELLYADNHSIRMNKEAGFFSIDLQVNLS